jgi:hypothetical protein
VKSVKYLGSVVNGHNSIEEEIMTDLLLAVKHTLPTKKYLKANYCQRKPN